MRKATRAPKRTKFIEHPPLGIKAAIHGNWEPDILSLTEGIPEMMNALDIPTRKDFSTNRIAFWADFPLFIRDKHSVYGYRSALGGWCRIPGMSPGNLPSNVAWLGSSNPVPDTTFVLRTIDFYADKGD